MERLTNHFDYCKMIDCKFYDAELYKQGKCKFFDKSVEHCHEKRMNDKLREYEDAEEQLLKAAGVDLQSMVGEFMHYYTLQKEGRLVELPCKVGDTVYEANHFWNRVIERNVAFVLICKSSIYVKNGCGDSFEFGKECFLTREEAEAALERMSGNA